MADFYSFIGQIESQFEGGFQNFSNDNGNWTGGVVGSGNLVGTNHGIAAPTLSSWLGRAATVDDMKNLDAETAKQIFKKYFWDRINGDLINSQGIAEFMFDWSLGSDYWYPRFHKVLNAWAGTNYNSYDPIGPKTIDTLNNIQDKNGFLLAMKKEREQWYHDIVAQSPDQGKFLQSWLSRTEAMFNKWFGNLTQEVEEIASATVDEAKKKVLDNRSSSNSAINS